MVDARTSLLHTFSAMHNVLLSIIDCPHHCAPLDDSCCSDFKKVTYEKWPRITLVL